MTKIINNENSPDFHHQFTFLKTGEQPLLCFKQDESNWLLVTGDRIIEEKNGATLFIPYRELIEVGIALYEEYKDGVIDKTAFTRLVLKDTNGKSYIIKSEKGEAYKGIYQMLHHVASTAKDSTT